MKLLKVGRGMLGTAVAGLMLLGGWLMVLGEARPVQAITGVVLVDKDAMGTPNGMSWGTAYTNVQDALAAATSGDEIWVADGTYYPDEGTGQTDNDRDSTFQLIDEIELYGGFAGGEGARSQRDVVANLTVLSGDLDKNDLSFEPEVDSDSNASTVSQTDHLMGANAYHVVTGSGADETAVLDGFTVTAGLANGSNPNNRGGGMYNNSGSPRVSHVTFSGNSADDGGGMYNSGGSPTMSQMIFSGNSASSSGGGMFINSGSPSVSQATFSGNSADGGGGMYNISVSNPMMSQVTFNGNFASDRGGGMYNSFGSITVSHVTFSGNFAYDGGGMYNHDTSSVSHVTFSGNSASNYGGGMYNNNGSPRVSHVTFSGNSAIRGGGVYNSGSPTQMSHVTFSGNSASSSGGGMYNISSGPTLTNTIIANSMGGGDCVNHFTSSVTDGGHNLIEDGVSACGLTNGTNNNIVGSDPSLGALADNGGSTLTHKPMSGSDVIDAGSGCSGVDQRGAARPYDDPSEANVSGACDIGAVEVREMLTSVTCGAGDLSGVSTFPFGSGTVTIDVTTANGLNCVTVEEMGTDHFSATAPIQTSNWWHISGNITSGLNIALTLPYSVATDADTRVCKWPGNLGGYGWDCDDGSNTTFAGNFVTRSGVTGFSDWAVGQGAGPTAVTLQTSDVASTNLSWLVWVGAVLVLVSSGVLVGVRRRD